MTFRFKELELPGVVLVEPEVYGDERGFFAETYKQSDFEAFGIAERFVQDSHSRSVGGVLRGLHYQMPPKAQSTMVRAVVGRIFDVAVDVRRDEPTYGKWIGLELSADNKRMLLIPPWCAHGFCVLSEEAEVVYKMTEEYAPEHEITIRWDDPDLGIRWPVAEPIVSPRDQAAQRLRDVEVEFEAGGRGK